MAQENQKKHRHEEGAETEEVEAKTETEVDDEAIDDLLDDIDKVLEADAETFVSQYRQAGGE